MNTAIKNILFPTDFSELSDNALETAIAMCKRQNARLHVLHVVENRFLIAPPEANIAAVYIVPELEEKGMRMLTELTENINATHKIAIEKHLEFGNPADVIINKVVELNSDIIVMGTHGASGVREFFIGTNAYTVIKNTTTPVLTVPGEININEFKKILFPLRATKGIREKYDFMVPIIEKNNAALIIAGLSLPGEVYKLSEMEDEIRELTKMLQANETSYRTEFFVCKNYAKKVLEIAESEKADLIVINATLDYNWSQFFIGPYAQQVVNHAKVPVLSIRTPTVTASYADVADEEILNISQTQMAF